MTLDWATAFVWTLALELPIYALLLGRCFRRWWGPLALTLAVNSLTHPALWFALPRFEPYWLWLLTVETGVVLVEAVAIAALLRRRASLGRAFGASLAANAFSTVIGLGAQLAAGLVRAALA